MWQKAHHAETVVPRREVLDQFAWLGTDGADPNRWMRILVWPRPHVDVFIMIELAVMVEQVIGPGLQDDIEGLFEARPAFS